MSSTCQSSSLALADAHAQIDPTDSNLHKWASSDAEFVRAMAAGTSKSYAPNHSPIVDIYSCRQKFLKSYTFSKKETVPEKTANCFRKVKQSAAALPCIRRPRSRSGEKLDRFSMLRRREECDETLNKAAENRKNRSVFLRTFHRLFSCVVGIDDVDGDSAVHALQD